MAAAVAAFAAARPSATAFVCGRIKVIDSRGSGEPIGTLSPPGQAVVTALRRAYPYTKISVVPNPYPAKGRFALVGAELRLPTAYHRSVVAGKDWLRSDLASVASNCGDATKVVLVGYSQGAQVAADVYQEGTRAKVLATVLFGDPYFNSRDTAADRGSYRRGRNGGLGIRPLYSADARGHVLSFCHDRDPVCQEPLAPADYRLLFKHHNTYASLGEPEAAAATIRQRDLADLPISPLGLGPVRLGMTLGQARRALGTPIKLLPSVYDCAYWRLPGARGRNLSLVADHGALALIGPDHIATSSRGIRAGDTLTKVLQLYGQLRQGRTGTGDYWRPQYPQLREYFADETHDGVKTSLDFGVNHGKVLWMYAGVTSYQAEFTECA
jgi:hypothetical protein